MTRTLKPPALANAERLAKDDPNAFRIPSRGARRAVKVGELVRVSAYGIYFWVMVWDEVSPGVFEGYVRGALPGTVSNVLDELAAHGLENGDRMRFSADNIFNLEVE